jgi:hypothetical protein
LLPLFTSPCLHPFGDAEEGSGKKLLAMTKLKEYFLLESAEAGGGERAEDFRRPASDEEGEPWLPIAFPIFTCVREIRILAHHLFPHLLRFPAPLARCKKKKNLFF